MSTDIARVPDRQALAVFGSADDALDRLARWVKAARDARDLVAPLIETAFVPDAYRPKVSDRATDKEKQAAYQLALANATAAILQGISLGWDPLTSLQQIYIVHGRPGMYAEAMVALLKSRGHDVWVEDLTDTRAVVCGRRAGSDAAERVTITMEAARKAGWTSNQAYAKTPQDMLYARAASRVCRRVAPDVLLGIASVEEIQDSIQTSASVGNGTRTVRPRHTPAAVTATPAGEEPTLEPDGEPAAPVPERPTPARMRALHASLRAHGLDQRDAGLAYIAQELGRPVSSTKDLTADEVRHVMDVLDRVDVEAEPTVEAEPELELDGDWPEVAKPGGE